MLQQKKWLITLLAFSVFLINISCGNFYRAKPGRTGSYTPGTIDSLLPQGRFFILRNGTQAFLMNNMMMSGDRKTLSFTPDSLTPEHKLHVVNGPKGKTRYKKTDLLQLSVLSEVHIYIPQTSAVAVTESYTLPLDQVQKIEVIKKNKGRSIRSHVIGSITIGLSVFLIAFVVAFASSWGDGIL